MKLQQPNSKLLLIAHNVRSAHNVGSLLRTADVFAVSQVIFTGYTPYPRLAHDTRLDYLVEKLTKQIAKVALGAEKIIPCMYYPTLSLAIDHLRREEINVYALEQSKSSVALPHAEIAFPAALLVGNEIDGLNSEDLGLAEHILEIPMLGSKESLNVSVAAGIALYELRRAGMR